MQTTKIVTFFKNYLAAFECYDLNKMTRCYHFPCTLHTPDRIVLLSDIKTCEQEIKTIFNQLQQEKSTNIQVKKASYSAITDNLLLANIEWEFIDDKNAIFANFCAIYHLILINNELKIISVVSHDLSNSQSLDYPIILTN